MMHDDQQSKDSDQALDHSVPNSYIEDINRSDKLHQKNKRISVDEKDGISFASQDSSKNNRNQHSLLTPCEVEMIEELRAGDVFGTSNQP